jgi:hypothetical protein
MTDKRIYNLPTEQSTYAEDLFLVVDESTLQEARKVKMSVIAPKINTLTGATGVNPDTYVIRVNNGSGAETKMTITQFIALFQDDNDVVDVQLYDPDDVLVCKMTLRRFGKMVTGVVEVLTDSPGVGTGDSPTQLYANTSGSLYRLPEGMRPTYDCHFYTNLGDNKRNILVILSTGYMWSRIMDDDQFGRKPSFPIAFATE